MLVIEVKKGESIDKALKRYKYKVIKTKQIEQVRNKQVFTKKSVKKRDQLKKAKYIQFLKQKNMD
jgi:small subunit ribosomal protein S21